MFDHYKEGLGIPAEGKGGEDEATWTRFRKWLKVIEERPSLKSTMSEREHYLPIYQVSGSDECDPFVEDARANWALVAVRR